MRLEKDKFGRPDLQVVRARDRDQALVFSGALGPAAANLDAVTVDDERAHAAVEVVQPLRQLVKPFLAGVAQLAALLEGGRRIVPPPSSMAHCIGRWQSLARSMDGKLDVGAMAVAGQYQGMPASVSTGWGPSGAPVSTEIRLRLSWSLGASRHVSTSDDLAALPPGAMALAADCLRGRHHLEIDDSELVLVSPPLTEQLSEIDVVLDKMLRLAHELRAGAVYR
jgi:hypothetical protein